MANSKAREGGGSFLLLVMLVVVAGLGGWNYHRNYSMEEEQADSRPFQGYSDTALNELAAAYSDQTDILNRKYQASLERRSGVRNQEGLIMEKIEEFERVQQIGESIRAATSLAADSQARLRQIEDEQAWRRNTRQWKLHLRRLTSI